MGLDAELVRDAEAARQRLIQSQHAAEQAKADYHHSIRRLHAAGGSLREIAEVLRLSHQRIHQIIDDAAEPEPRRRWWRRRGRRTQPPAGPCAFCGRSREECTNMIEGPGIFICDACVAHASRLAAGSAAEAEAEVEVGAAAPMLVEPSGSDAKCNFCEQTQHMQRLVAGSVASAPGGKVGKVGGRPRICDECLALCEVILAETASS